VTWPEDLVSRALTAPQTLQDWPETQWTALIQQARAAGLLGRIALLSEAGAGPSRPWPAPVQGHFEAARRVGRAQQAEVLREIGFIRAALADLGAPVLLLKGSAYVAAGLPAAQGRVFSDIDIMVPKSALPQAEAQLMQGGWLSTHHNAYDQRYYREWMHELPPMQHLQRGTTIDVHHTILPETARLRPDPRKLFERARPLPGRPGLFTLSATDMVLHSMTHLFVNDDMGHALRDLSDLDLLLRHFSNSEPDFWAVLPERAQELDLARPLYYGLRWTRQVLRTPVPDTTLAAAAGGGPGPLWSGLMDMIWRRALRPLHPRFQPPLTGAALGALYVRGHWQRMPPLLLARHLTIKALGWHERKSVADAAAAQA
jgi:hypothetical protein